LQVDNFGYLILRENMVASLDTFIGTESNEQSAQCLKLNITVSVARQNPFREFAILAHVVLVSSVVSR